MKIAVEGCAHGELETIYDTIQLLEEKEDVKIDLLICCGDFQACRNEDDLHCMAIPQKYYNMCSFYKYYNGEKIAPILTIFVGGNHEASNYLQELPYGGWVAPNIYYLGYAGVINIAGIRIGGISGIYKGPDYYKGRFEKAPYDNSTKRSVYHIRNLEVFRLKQLSNSIDIFISHDWPNGIWNYGDAEQLLRFKPFFKDDMETGKLGSKPCESLLNHLQPNYWFAAHLHCKFAAVVPHANEHMTRFLALDKCLPKRRFLQITDIPHDSKLKIEIQYDIEWLTILNLTNHLLSVKAFNNFLPSENSVERWQFTPTAEEKSNISAKFGGNLTVPNNFVKTVRGYDPDSQDPEEKHSEQQEARLNEQTILFCSKLTVDDPLALLNVKQVHGKVQETELMNDSLDVEGDTSDNEVSPTSTSVKLSLTLPEPKYDVVEHKESFVCEKSLVTSERGAEKEEEIITTEANVPVKKFKRRNASIYGNSEDV